MSGKSKMGEAPPKGTNPRNESYTHVFVLSGKRILSTKWNVTLCRALSTSEVIQITFIGNIRNNFWI
jgi:hypothetical protein